MRVNFFPSNISQPNNFNLLRVILATCVIVSHAFPLSLGIGAAEPLWNLTRQQIDLGKFAVDAFFIISGFLVANSWFYSRGPADYLKKRSLRIFPGLAGALLFCIFVVGPLGGAHLPSYFRDMRTWSFGEALFLRDVDPISTLPGVFQHIPYPHIVNGPLNTIRYEFSCYLMILFFGLVGLLGRRPLVTAVFAVALGMYARFHSVETHIHWYGSLHDQLRYIAFFLAGSTFYVWRERIPKTPWLFAFSLAVLAVFHAHFLTAVLPIFGTYALLYLAYTSHPRLARFGTRWDLSYGLYLYGWPVEQLLMRFFPAISGPGLLLLGAMPLSCGLAALSWHFVEQPALRLKKTVRLTIPPVVMPRVEVAGPVD